ncbi:hypothetical protein VTI74DRAFT_2481 [Chaetomium olivicolor]
MATARATPGLIKLIDPTTYNPIWFSRLQVVPATVTRQRCNGTRANSSTDIPTFNHLFLQVPIPHDPFPSSPSFLLIILTVPVDIRTALSCTFSRAFGLFLPCPSSTRNLKTALEHDWNSPKNKGEKKKDKKEQNEMRKERKEREETGSLHQDAFD